MGLFSLITTKNRTKFYIVQTKHIYKLDEENQLIPIEIHDYEENEEIYVRDPNLKLGNSVFHILDSAGKSN